MYVYKIGSLWWGRRSGRGQLGIRTISYQEPLPGPMSPSPKQNQNLALDPLQMPGNPDHSSVSTRFLKSPCLKTSSTALTPLGRRPTQSEGHRPVLCLQTLLFQALSPKSPVRQRKVSQRQVGLGGCAEGTQLVQYWSHLPHTYPVLFRDPETTILFFSFSFCFLGYFFLGGHIW